MYDRAGHKRRQSASSRLASAIRPAAEDVLVGRTLGERLLLTTRLAGGAFGAVYTARHLHLGKLVAVKVLHPGLKDDPSVRARFHAEAQATSRLDHESLVRVLDFGEERDGALWLAMDLIDGRSLGAALQSAGRFTALHATSLMLQIAAGLGHAHAHGIVHGDVKPSNVLLVMREGDDGEPRELVKLFDFGVVKSADGGGGATVLGTPAYMSPEQCLGEALDQRSDVYACGVLFFELLTGRTPFEGDAQALLRQHLVAPPPSPASRVADVPPAVCAVVARAMAKEPHLRFASMRDLRAALRELAPDLGAPHLARRSSVTPPPPSVQPPELPPPPSEGGEGGERADAGAPTLPVEPRETMVAPSSDLRSSSAVGTRRDRSGAYRRSDFAPPAALDDDPVAAFLEARSIVDLEREELARALAEGDVEDVAFRVSRLVARGGAGAARALSLLADPARLAPIAERLLGADVASSPHVERMVAQLGHSFARAFWAARIRRPATAARRMRFVTWMRAVGRPAHETLQVALVQLATRAPSASQSECTEDVLLALPRMLDDALRAAVMPLLASPDARIRKIAAAACPIERAR